MTAIEDIAAERKRQIEVEGWHAEHDDALNDCGDLARAAACYALGYIPNVCSAQESYDLFWPWDFKWWKPKDRRRDLVRAAALIVAEIERLDRSKP